MNPDKYEKIEQKKLEDVQMKKARLQDDAYVQKMQMGWFEAKERTIHKDIIPARERIEFYRRKLPKDPSGSFMQETTASTRPTTKSTARVRTAKP
jgi:hypothetical protein